MGIDTSPTGVPLVLYANCVVAPVSNKGNVAEVLEIPPSKLKALPAELKTAVPHTSQSPAERDIDVMLAGVEADKLIALPATTVELTYSPMLPVLALSFVFVPGY
jgi:hypothetical protein